MTPDPRPALWLRFVVPADLDRPTGGNRYDAAVARSLAEAGTDVDLVELPGSWPDPAPPDHDHLAGALICADPVLVDGLLACGAPDAVTAAIARGTAVHVLVHLPLAADPTLDDATAADRDAREREALNAATGVIVTSAWGATELRRRHGLNAVVATPGADSAPVARGSRPPRLRHLATVSPLKDQSTVVAALAVLRDLPWTAELTGALDVDAAYVAEVRAAIEAHGLTGRVRLTGPLTGADLDHAWDATDLLLLPSRAETWGLVVTEALSRGIPAVVGDGTGAVEALGRAADGTLPGAVVPPGDPTPIAAAIRHLLGAGRDVARRAALERRATLPTWRRTAEIVQAAITHTLPERPVDPGWLTLREPADNRARDAAADTLLPPLLRRLQSADPGNGRPREHRPREQGLHVVDLGAGTGANLRWLAPRLAPLGPRAAVTAQRWTLVDHDPRLTSWGPVRCTTTVRADVADLPELLHDNGRVDLLTAAALLDLLDTPALTAVVDAVVTAGVPALFSLSVTGAVVMTPDDAADDDVRAAFDAHQRRGGRLGPDAPRTAVRLFRDRGWHTTTAATPWRLAAAEEPDLLREWLAGRAEAAVEWRPELAEPVTAWLDRRRAQIDARVLTAVVDHSDLLALPYES